MSARFEFEGHPGRSLTVLLFTDVENAKQIREGIVSGTVKPDFAFFNAEAVPSLLPLQLAAHKALTAEARGTLVTRSLHAEALYNISGSKHISESLRRFGVADASRALLAARFDATDADLAALRALIAGTEAPLLPLDTDGGSASLAAVAKPALVAKYYKLAKHEAADAQSVAEAIACRIAARDCLS